MLHLIIAILLAAFAYLLAIALGLPPVVALLAAILVLIGAVDDRWGIRR